MSILFGNFTNAELYIYDVFDSKGVASNDAYTQILNDYDSDRWYTSSDTINCESDKGVVTITSPVVEDALLYEATVYRLFLSPYRVSQLKKWGSDVDTSKIIMKESSKDLETEKVTFDISTADGLVNNQIYYAFLLPISEYEEVWTPSHEFCFQLENNMCVWDEACDSLSLVINSANVSSVEEQNVIEEQNVEEHGAAVEENLPNEDEQHNAACIWMDLANVTHTISSDNVITLKWTSLGDNSTVQIAIFDPEDEIYKPLWSARMDDEKFDYKMKWNWEQNFSLTNWCRDVYYKVDASMKTTDQPIEPPVTGPAENILVIALVAIALYGLYAIFFRKAEDN